MMKNSFFVQGRGLNTEMDYQLSVQSLPLEGKKQRNKEEERENKHNCKNK